MVHGGLCLSHLEDETTVFVDGAIPGEVVVAKLDYRKRHSWFATVIQVLQPSPDRVVPPCPYYADCGGCQLQHVAYERQLQLKVEIVRDAMRRAGVSLPEPLEVRGASNPWRYRWRGEFHVIPGKDGLADAELGFNRARSWKPISVADCLIHHPQITDNLPALRAGVRAGANAKLGTLHLTVGEDGSELLIRAKPQAALQADVLAQVAATDAAKGRWSTEATSLHWRGSTFRVTPESFIQVNWQQLEALYGTVLQAMGELAGKRVIDAYAGIGVLAVELAKQGAQVTCIENNQSAVRMGKLNARLNGVEGDITYIGRAVEESLATLPAADVVLLDPPRAGCASSVTAWLALSGPPQVVYVSCEPSTLARDLHLLVASGPYTISDFAVVDLFPQTYHLESVAILQRQVV